MKDLPAAVSASKGVNLYELARRGYLKLTGRAIPNEEGYLETDFSSSGFETIISVPEDTTLDLTVSSCINGRYDGHFTLYVDDEEHTFFSEKGDNVTLSVPVPKGQHLLRVIKEAILDFYEQDYTRMNSIRFEGTVDQAAPDKPLYLLVIGASGQCGAHADVSYWPGTIGGPLNHYVTRSGGFRLAELLNADINVVARGGIGLWMTDTQEPVVGKVRMQDLYPYSSFLKRIHHDLYDFSKERKPDLIVVALSGNDKNAEPLLELWVDEAKKFLLYLKKVHGQDVPIVWDFAGNKDILFRGLREAIETDPDLSAYQDIYLFATSSNANGGAALTTQTNGHPDALDYAEQGERLYHFITSEGILRDKLQPKELSDDRVFYVSETGDDSSDGLTAGTAFRTFAEVFRRLPVHLPQNTRLIIRVTGRVSLNAGHDILGTDTVYRSDGSRLPVVVETNGFDGSEKAVLKISEASFGMIWSSNDLTLLDVTLQNLNATDVSLFAEGSRIVLDNVDFKGFLSGQKLHVYGNTAHLLDFSNDEKESLSEIIFKHGLYNASTGFGEIAAVGGEELIAKEGEITGGSPRMVCRIVISEGAELSDVKFMTSFGMNVKRAEIEVATRGLLRPASNQKIYCGTASGTESNRQTVNADLSFVISGGHFEGGFSQLGDHVTVNGNVSFTMNGGELRVPAAMDTDANSIVLGGGRLQTEVKGNVLNTFSDGRIYVESGDDVQSALFMGGRDESVISGKLINTIDGTHILFVKKTPGAKAHERTGVYFAMNTGVVKTELVNNIRRGLFELRQVDRDLDLAGGDLPMIRKMTNIIGVPAGKRSVGPQIAARRILIGGRKAIIGDLVNDQKASQRPISETVLSSTVYGMRLTFGSLMFCPHDDTAAVYGGVETTIFHGYYLGGQILLNVCDAPVFGHVKIVLNGGLFEGVDGTMARGRIYDGLEYVINNYHDFNRATQKEYPFTIASCAYLAGENWPALSVTVNGGTFHGPFTFCQEFVNVDGPALTRVNGGWFQSIDSRNAKGCLYGGHFQNVPSVSSLAACHQVIAGLFRNTEETKDIVEYSYQIIES